MIVFSLDHILADCRHRAYFVDPEESHPDYYREKCNNCHAEAPHPSHPQKHKGTGVLWRPDWNGYENACEGDAVIEAAARLLRTFSRDGRRIEIWTGRSMTVRDKTIQWIKDKIWKNRHATEAIESLHRIRMRPVGVICSDSMLKLNWLRDVRESGQRIACAFEANDKMIDIFLRKRITCIQVWVPEPDAESDDEISSEDESD